MKIIDIKRLNDMIQDMKDLDDLVKIGLTKEDVEGYLDFFADNIVKPLTTVFEGTQHEKYQR
jgi:hypothetical protein